jgi:hypothetical protein
MASARRSTAVALGEFGPGNADAWQRRLLVAGAGADRLHLPETCALVTPPTRGRSSLVARPIHLPSSIRRAHLFVAHRATFV